MGLGDGQWRRVRWGWKMLSMEGTMEGVPGIEKRFSQGGRRCVRLSWAGGGLL